MACYCGSCWKHNEETNAVKSDDVRATRTHTVSLTLLVQGEDSGKAIERVIAALGSGMHVERVSALPYEPEDDRW